ncbi:cation:proton antiporter [bacterium]|nr:cation:proton antiporter [bacterium]RQV96618.1 MAG: sodium:proton exchanger [bacterium]
MNDPFTVMSAVVVCSALLAWLASQTRQPILIGYFLCGILLGPSCFHLVTSVEVLQDLSQLGVILLLFLAGLVLHPDRLKIFFKRAIVATLAGSALTWILIFTLLKIWGFPGRDCLIAAVALMFSSTILVVKLLPTTTLHQKRMGSICIAILIAEDLLAVGVLLFVGPQTNGITLSLLWLPLKAVLLIAVAVFGEQFVLRKMMWKADRYREVQVMLCLGWCVGIALLGSFVGIPNEVGAFVAGVTIARGKIALILSEQLKPLRDFFLMFFFFVLGVGLEFAHLHDIWLPALLAAGLILGSRPFWLRFLFRRFGEESEFTKETGIRLGQASEFSLVIAVAASGSGHLSEGMAQLIQIAAVLTMLVSSYIVILMYPSPIGVRPNLQRD